MITFIINTFLLFVKVLTFSVLNNSAIIFKFVLLLSLLAIIYLLYNYPKSLENDLFIIGDYYKIHTDINKIISWVIFCVYVILFSGGILIMRFYNSGRSLDLEVIYKVVYRTLLSYSLIVNLINILLILLLLVTYLLLLNKLMKFFKKHWIKLHIYYNVNSDWYLYNIVQGNFYYKRLILRIEQKYPRVFEKRFFKFKLSYHCIILLKNLHYIMLIIVVVYDMKYNNLVLYKIFKILPYIFLYEVYLRFSDFYVGLDFLYNADEALYHFIYVKDIQLLNDKEFFLDGDLYTIDYITKIICIYLKNSLNAKYLCIVMENGIDYWYERYYDYNYFTDCKKRKLKK